MSDIAAELEALFGELVVAQRKKVMELAQRLHPRITEDDLLNPHDVAALIESSAWNYEDGVLNGFLAAQMAVRARLRR